jgi:hypothetical protein
VERHQYTYLQLYTIAQHEQLIFIIVLVPLKRSLCQLDSGPCREDRSAHAQEALPWGLRMRWSVINLYSRFDEDLDRVKNSADLSIKRLSILEKFISFT